MPRRPATRTLARRVGARIRAVRLETDITQEQLAWSCNLAKAYLSQVESGKRLPSLSALAVIAKRLKVEPADLLMVDLKDHRMRLADSLRRDDDEQSREALRALGWTGRRRARR